MPVNHAFCSQYWHDCTKQPLLPAPLPDGFIFPRWPCEKAAHTLKSSLLQGQKAKRKVGRPITYQGDPFSPDVTPEQRRLILRRVANRESARRVRDRRHEELERLTQKVSSTCFVDNSHTDAAVQDCRNGVATAAL